MIDHEDLNNIQLLHEKLSHLLDIIEKDIYTIRTKSDTQTLWVPLHKPADTSAHYKEHSGIEVIDFITANNLPFTIGNVVKYVARCQKSGKWEADLRKAEIYIAWTRDLIKRGVISVKE